MVAGTIGGVRDLNKRDRLEEQSAHSSSDFHLRMREFASSNARNGIDELAKEYEGKGGTSSKVFLLAVLIAFMIGILAIMDLATVFWPQIKVYLTSLGVTEWISGNLTAIVLFLVMVFATALISGVVIVRLSRDHGAGLIRFSMYALIVLPWVLLALTFLILAYTGLLSSVLSQIWLLGACFVVPAIFSIIGLAIFHWLGSRIERAGTIISLSGQLLSEERELVLPPIISVMLTLLTFASAAAIGGSFYYRFILPAADPIIYIVLLGVIEFLFLLLIVVITYSMDGIIIAIAHIWYRNRDPRFRDGRIIVWSRLGRIAKFGVLAAIVKSVIGALRSRGRGSGGVVFRIAGGLIGTIWYYINYFTLPSIILEDLPITQSIKKSAKRLFGNFGDVLIREWGVNFAMGALKFLVTGIFAMVGLYFSLTVGLQGWMILGGVLAFVIVAGIATFPIFRAMRVSYLTILFSYIWDKETGFTKPSRIPTEVKKDIEQWYKSELPEIKTAERDKWAKLAD